MFDHEGYDGEDRLIRELVSRIELDQHEKCNLSRRCSARGSVSSHNTRITANTQATYSDSETLFRGARERRVSAGVEQSCLYLWKKHTRRDAVMFFERVAGFG
jgi:hypothetical protein